MKKLMQLTIMVAVAVIIAGCQTATQPGRANTQTTTLDDNSTITVDQSVRNTTSAIGLPAMPPEGYSTNAFAQLKELMKFQRDLNGKDASESKRTYGDVFTQNQMIENSGSEANNPTATSTPSVTTPIDVSWGNASTGSTTAAASSFVSGVNYLWGLITGKSTSTDTAAAKKPTNATGATGGGACTGGACSDGGTGGGCSDGCCSIKR